MYSAPLRLLFVLAISAQCGLTPARAADAELKKLKTQLDAIKANYEKQIQELEKRISELEANAGKTSAEALAASMRALTNAEAIEIIQRKLQAGATETRDIYRDDANWPFDLKRLYDLLGTEGSLWKITLAPQVSRGGRFFSRPVIRLFVTYAVWSDEFKGLVGGTPYANATDGLSYGIQAEAWW